MPRHGRVWRWSLDELRRAAVGLRQALLREHIIEVVDRSNPRQYVYRVRGSDGKQAQRATPAAD